MSAPPSEHLFGAPGSTRTADQDFRVIRDSAEFRELKRRTLRFVLPATALFMGNYLLFVLLSAYAPSFMAIPALGLINIGMLIGMFQFVTTMVIVVAYGRYARDRIDPVAEGLRDRVEHREEAQR